MPTEPPNAAGNSRLGGGTQPPRRPLIPRWVRLLLYPVFSALLLIPALRRLRRDARRWNGARLAAGAASAASIALGIWWGAWWLVVVAGFATMVALLLRPSRDPDRERDLQRRYQAEYLLNGGRLVSQWPSGGPPRGTVLYLLVRGREILAVPVDGAGDVAATLNIAHIQQILVNGETYRPVYVSEAKDPPVRERTVDKNAAAVLTLVMAGGARLDLDYTGAFSRHLAESAAHALYSVRKLGTAHGVSGESPEIFHIVGR
jgi:hypothetical protein